MGPGARKKLRECRFKEPGVRVRLRECRFREAWGKGEAERMQIKAHCGLIAASTLCATSGGLLLAVCPSRTSAKCELSNG